MLKRYFFLCAALCTACALGPDYERPTVHVPLHFKETSPNWKMATPKDKAKPRKWWGKFQDTKLNALESQLIVSNQNIANAEANYRQAMALVDKARAAYFPTLGFDADVLRSKLSSTTNTTNPTLTTQSMSLAASWEPDVWGLVRRTVESNQANAEASAALQAATQLSATATLAQTYFELQNLDSDQALLDATIKSNQRILEITKNQYASGVAARADVVQAEANLKTTEAAAINNHIARAQYEHAIAVLVGKAPADFSLASHPLQTKIPSLEISLPSTLLERRPDVAQAERLMAAANANIGVAQAAYFPNFTLSASAGYSGINLSHWVNEPALNWALGPALAQTIFDAGARSATVEAAWAAYDASVANYRQTVLAAFQDVEDNLVSLRVLTEEATQLEAAASKQAVALRLVLNQYHAGTVPFSSVSTAQITHYTAQKNAIDVRGLQIVAMIGLMKSLGGDWE